MVAIHSHEIHGVQSVFLQPLADRSNSTIVCIGRWVRSVEDSDFTKQNDREPAARPLTDIPTKLEKHASLSLDGRLPHIGREKISSRASW